MILRGLNPAGDDLFRDYLKRVRGGVPEAPPHHLLESPETSTPLPANIDIAELAFPSKLEFAAYLEKALSPLSLPVLRNNLGIWSWLALFYFDQLAPATADGKRKLLAPELYVPSAHYQRKYRHLVFGPFLSFKLHRMNSRLMLTKPISVWSDLEEQLIGVQEIIQIPGALEAAALLYFDDEKQQPKVGATNRKKGGTIRRFRELLLQLDLTFDIYSLAGTQLVDLLPKEFDRFRPPSNPSVTSTA